MTRIGSRRAGTSLLVLAGVSVIGCGGSPSAAEDRQARERVVERYLDAIEARDTEAALRLVTPNARATAADDIAAAIARLGGRDLDVATVRIEQPFSSGYAIATVTLPGLAPERVEIGRSEGAWWVVLGDPAPERPVSSVSS